jgi:16S rRNA (uracil1498-N3)-methyltransferase
MKASRVRSGDTIELFDMNGTFRKAVVLNTDKTGTEIQLLEEKNKKKHEQLKISLGVALPKGNRSDWLFEKITELGVRFIFSTFNLHALSLSN